MILLSFTWLPIFLSSFSLVYVIFFFFFSSVFFFFVFLFFFFQAEDGIRYLVRSRGLGDVYKRQLPPCLVRPCTRTVARPSNRGSRGVRGIRLHRHRCRLRCCLLYTSDAADERSSVDLGGRRIIKKKTKTKWSNTALDINRLLMYIYERGYDASNSNSTWL